jgi:anti-sigma factor RsiW
MTDEHRILQRLAAIEAHTQSLVDAKLADRMARIETDMKHLQRLPSVVESNALGQAEDRATAKTRIEDANSLRGWIGTIFTIAMGAMAAGGVIVAIAIRITTGEAL